MLSPTMLQALNQQIVYERQSAYIYMAIEADFADRGLPGFVSFFKHQAEEEEGHARRFIAYVNDRHGRVSYGALEAPGQDFGGPLPAFEASLKHEQFITSKINELMKLARAENDYATENFLQWFLSEQVEEESSMQAILDKLALVGEHRPALLILDHELGKRGE